MTSFSLRYVFLQPAHPSCQSKVDNMLLESVLPILVNLCRNCLLLYLEFPHVKNLHCFFRLWSTCHVHPHEPLLRRLRSQNHLLEMSMLMWGTIRDETRTGLITANYWWILYNIVLYVLAINFSLHYLTFMAAPVGHRLSNSKAPYHFNGWHNSVVFKFISCYWSGFLVHSASKYWYLLHG